MATNPYVSNYTEVSEQELQDELVIEAIQMKGFDVSYMQRSLIDYDYLYGEDPTSAFSSAVEIEMYLTNVDGFGGSGDMITNFGLEINDTATFIVSKTRFTEEFTPSIDKPKVGDLIYMPITRSFLEIKHVEDESPFYELGKQYVWEVKTELFDFSYETFNTGNQAIDDLVANGIVDFDPATTTEDYGDNDDIQTETDTFVQFDPANPFGTK